MPSTRLERLARGMAWTSIGVSAILAALKISVGLAAHSVATVSDGFESAADFFTSGLVLFGLWVAAKPADVDHPYGHGRFETLIGLAIGVVLAATGAGISIRALEERAVEHAPVAVYAIWPLMGSIIAKGALGAGKFKIGKRSGSSSLAADAWNDVVDVLSGGVALIAILLAIYVPDMGSADHYGGFAIGLIVIFLGFKVVRETALQLMDTMPDQDQMVQIRRVALDVEGARAIEKCFARKTGLRYHVDLHLEVDPEMTVRESHEIAHNVKETILQRIDWVEDVLVHVEPHAGSLGSAASGEL